MSDNKRTPREVAEALERLRQEISGEKTTEPPKDATSQDGNETKGGEDRVLVTPPPKRRKKRGRREAGDDTVEVSGAEDASAEPTPAEDSPTAQASQEQMEEVASDPANTGTAADAGEGDQGTSGTEVAEPKERTRSRLGRRRRTRAGGLSSRQVQVADESATSSVIDDLLLHRRRRRGKVIGIAGLPRHGKTTLADRLRERAAERPGADLRYNKTERGDVNLYYIPGRRDHHVLIDMAGEDYQVLGDYERELPELMARFLWPVLQKMDGLILLMALPIVWSGWNDDEGRGRRIPSPEEDDEMRTAVERMLNAHRMLLKYAVVARNVRKLARRMPSLKLSREEPPPRDRIDDAFQQAPKYDRPVSLVLSKADLYVGRERECLFTPNLPRFQHRIPLGIRPEQSDPLLVASGHFPDFLDFLSRRVRFFKWSFAQAIEDRSARPNPLEAQADEADVSSLIGGEGVLDFLTGHPWGFPGMSTATALRLDRRLRRSAWDAAQRGGAGA